jgi:hypothetical protein
MNIDTKSRGLLLLSVALAVNACGVEEETLETKVQAATISKTFQVFGKLGIRRTSPSGENTDYPPCASTPQKKLNFQAFVQNNDSIVNNDIDGSSHANWNDAQNNGRTSQTHYRVWGTFKINASCTAANAVPTVTISNKSQAGGYECGAAFSNPCPTGCPLGEVFGESHTINTKVTLQGTSIMRVGFRFSGEPNSCVEPAAFNPTCTRDGAGPDPAGYQGIYQVGYIRVTCNASGVPAAVFAPVNDATYTWKFSTYPAHYAWLFDVTGGAQTLLQFSYQPTLGNIRYLFQLPALPAPL